MIFRSPHADVPIPPIAFHEFVLCHANELDEKPALIDAETGRSFTYKELVRDVYRCNGALATRGLRKGDVFALLLPNIPEFATAFFGVLAAGGVVTTLNPLYTANEIAHQLEDSGAKYLLTLPQLVEKAASAAAQHPLREIFVVGEAKGAMSFRALLESNCAPPSVSINAREDLAVLPYSSGTSGKPKGVMLTHANLTAGVLATVPLLPEEPGNALGILPFFHIAGMVCILLTAIQAGHTLVLLRRFEPEHLLRAIQIHKIQAAPLVPPLVVALAKYPAVEAFDLSSLKLIGCGAAPLGADVQRECSNRLRTPVIQGYGMTEASGVTQGWSIEAISKNKPGSVGPCVVNIECKVVDAVTARELGPNECGELWLRGPQVMKGYLNNPGATVESLDREGWYHTGDIGYADDDGCFYIVDRVKELIKCKAYQVAPAELEAILLTHPAIADAAVIPKADADVGEVPKAFLVAKGPVSSEEVIDFVAARVAPYKKIRFVEFVEQLPKSPVGKLLRRVLRDRESGRANHPN
jgi:acyl-CoA synthetase (AMP-forming)/AMP-acid ligase II